MCTYSTERGPMLSIFAEDLREIIQHAVLQLPRVDVLPEVDRWVGWQALELVAGEDFIEAHELDGLADKIIEEVGK